METICDENCNYINAKNPRNPSLCHACQPWDNFTHTVFCQGSIYARIDPAVFGPEFDLRDVQRTSNRDYFDQELSDLKFHPPQFYSSTKPCIVCSHVGKMLVNAGFEESHQLEVALWRPFPAQDRQTSSLNPQSQPLRSVGEVVIEHCIFTVCLKLETTFKPLVLQVELHYESKDGGLQLVKSWDRRYFHTSSLNQWLSACRTSHGEKCNQLSAHTQLPPGLRLIDTTLLCVVEASDRVEFAVLSYQWKTATRYASRDIVLSKNNLTQLEKIGALQKDVIPEVVFDAIQLCDDLGRQYLWVDRLCIVQDDPVSKQAQIEAMDAIYQMAEFTIVACADGVGVGLPGVSSRPRQPSLRNRCWSLIIDGKSVGATPMRINKIVNDSEWNTRGWTYQERLLPLRHIFFGNDYVYINCFEDGMILESWVTKQKYPPSPFRDHGNGFETGLRHDESYFRGYFSLYAGMVREYTHRQLGDRSDILRAFSGVSNIFCTLANTRTLFGIPERYLLQGLLWSYIGTNGQESDQLGIPTWSWASWNGQSSYTSVVGPDPLRFQNVGSRNHFGNLVSVFYCEPTVASGQLRPSLEEKIWFHENTLSDESEVSVEDQILWNTDHRMRGGDDPATLWTNFIHGPLEALRRRQIDEETRARAEQHPNSLVFNTTVAVLRMDSMPQGDDQDHPYVQLGIYGEEGNLVGETARMHKEFISKVFKRGEKHHVFVLAASHMGKLFDPIFSSGRHPFYRPNEPWALLVMIASRRGYLYSRLVVGVVTPATWTSVKPRWEPVILI